MALTGLDIYKLLPKTNCKDCGFATCLAFAMALAQKRVSLDKCPHVTSGARDALESASQPPVKLVTIGSGDHKLEVGNETVMYRHEQKFHHPAGVGILVEDTLTDGELDKRIEEIGALRFDRIGQVLGVDLICVKNSSRDSGRFQKAVARIISKSKLSIALSSDKRDPLKAGLDAARDLRPLIVWESEEGLDEAISLAKDYKAPLAITASSLETMADHPERAKKAGLDELVMNLKSPKLAKAIQDFAYARRSALKKNFRPLGYPIMAFTGTLGSELELTEAISYILKYAGIVIVNNTTKEFILPLLVVRQDIYADPQKPVQVEAKVYEIGKPGKDSPIIVTTNFSITYFTVAGEVEASKVPTYILCCDSDGMSVLTAWAAEKFTAESIVEAMKKAGAENMVSHRRITIPGYVSVLSGRLEELSGWKVSVGPREASGLTAYLRNWR